jgi:curved DNA-binding protein CbpA
MAKFRTHYDNLNVSRNAPLSVIKAAYKVLCQKYHPDKYIGGHDEALRIMKSINSAYAVLSDSAKRAEHDQWIAQQERAQASDEAQRIMTIITNAYVAPSVANKPNPKDSSRNESSKRADFGDKILALAGNPLLKKITWIFGVTAVVGILLTVIILYLPELKSTTVTSANQDIAGILKKAEQLVKQGQAVKALPLYLQLAEQGNPDAQFNLGLMHAKGQGVAKDDKQAVEWFAKAAEQGYREAQTKLGYMYATGKGVAQSYVSAIYWCYQAAKQGDPTAQYNLGLMYEQGQGVARDVSLAVSWYSMAAAQGDARSQYNLGVMYENGVGVAKDGKQAAALFTKAAKQGLTEAITALEKMEQ